MLLEVGKIYEGKVTGITKFGAFVDLGEGKTGMVHISEVASTFVKEITDHVSQGDTVKVKVLNIAEDGKISLSIKRAADNPAPQASRPQSPRPQQSSRPPRPAYNNNRQPSRGRSASSDQPFFAPDEQAQQTEGNKAFEDMLSKFMQKSDEKISSLKSSMDGGRRSGSRRSR